MKRYLRKILLVAIWCTISFSVYSNDPPHPNNGNKPGDGDPVLGNGGGAPIGEGSGILILLGIAYATKRYYHFRKEIGLE